MGNVMLMFSSHLEIIIFILYAYYYQVTINYANRPLVDAMKNVLVAQVFCCLEQEQFTLKT